MIELRELQNLLSLDEHRHFGRAAEAVGLSQPSLTKSIQRLEKQLGTPLFDRSRPLVVPTSVGEAVIAHAKQILSDVSQLERSVQMLCGLEIGSLAVGIGPAMSESYVTQALAKLADEHPHVQIHVRVDHWRQLSEWLLAGDIDLLVADLADAADDNRFSYTPLPAEEFTWFCRSGHPLGCREQVTRSDLVRFPLATPRMPPWAQEWLAEALSSEDHKSSRSYPTIQCENYSMLKRVVLASNCISVALAVTIRPELAAKQLTALAVDAPTLTTHAGIVQLSHRTVSPLAREFMKHLESLGTTQE